MASDSSNHHNHKCPPNCQNPQHNHNHKPAHRGQHSRSISTHSRHPPARHRDPPDISQAVLNYGMGPGNGVNSYTPTPNAPTTFNPVATFQHIQDMATKRVSTLDYLRKTHEGRVYWFNTLLFSKTDISRLPSFTAAKMARRASNLLLLGLSLPTLLDLSTSSSTALDYLRALNALLAEFETYQSIHPSDGSGSSGGIGSASSSLSRARLPAMFKRSHTAGGKGAGGRRASSAAEIGMPFSSPAAAQSSASGDGTITGLDSSTNSSVTAISASLTPASSTANVSTNGTTGGASTGVGGPAGGSAAFAAAEQELLPGEEYFHLLTPSLPFDPDFFEVFATLCDVLIDCYLRVASLVASPAQAAPGLGEAFAKADARLRKVIVAGIIKEFEDATRSGVKGEVAGVGRVVLGGLM